MESGIDPGHDYYTQDYYNYDHGLVFLQHNFLHIIYTVLYTLKRMYAYLLVCYLKYVCYVFNFIFDAFQATFFYVKLKMH